MAAISASQVKELRERTGLGMMECKKALTEATVTSKSRSKTCVKALVLKPRKKRVVPLQKVRLLLV